MVHLAFALTGMLLTRFFGALAGRNVGRTRERSKVVSRDRLGAAQARARVNRNSKWVTK